jgi:hypothetical protein
MNDIGAMAREFEHAIHDPFGSSHLETRSQRAAGINERDEILGMTFRCMLEKRERFIETIRLPERARLPQLRQINTEAGDGLDRFLHGPSLLLEGRENSTSDSDSGVSQMNQEGANHNIEREFLLSGAELRDGVQRANSGF